MTPEVIVLYGCLIVGFVALAAIHLLETADLQEQIDELRKELRGGRE